MKIGYKTHIGMVRKRNEDSLLVLDKYYPKFSIFAVADGMGGHNAGEVASSMAIEGIKDYFLNNCIIEEFTFSDKEMNAVIKKINKDILEKSQIHSAFNGMGTTLTLVVNIKQEIHISHIGDSRVYKINDKGIKQLTEDHSLVAGLVKKGEITKEEAKIHPQKNVITRALGTDKAIYADMYHFKLYPEDIILLCTDGLTNSISENEIYRIINENKESDFQQIAEKLVTVANNNGGNDNISIIIFQ
ncbi:Stp1/IreP family PP2C-type Ser/Thr phosphatase [Garciella nitratireducens]|uniref:Protein phosphatase n=1 Tax=Garciella nitratireducens DSM 15102 TaxID=1121911 RepID=A0A1T4JZF9_9FIRM|nr:Stp1/IreP family PP2C-type Ser/Thr phosphatase [Garciella nitratireducens]RBP41109.1 protein phosphatase [Garciella nitratireducens]SJZ35437.1 protein phosphatase [Garciella nitratireducens DSM 15102]